MKPPILDVRLDEVREVTAALEQGRCVAILSPEVSGSSSVLQLAAEQLQQAGDTHIVVQLNLPRGSRLPLDDFFRSTLRHMIRRLRTAAPELDVRQIMSELYGGAGQSLLPDSHSAALHFEEVLAVLVDELLIPKRRRLVLAVDHLGRVSLDHLREFGNIIHRLWEELDGHLVLLTAGAEPLYTLCRRGSRDGHFSAFHIAHRVELKDLTPTETERFIRARLVQRELLLTTRDVETLVERIITWSAGHPYFIDRALDQIDEIGLDGLLSLPQDEVAALIYAGDPYLEGCQDMLQRGVSDKQRAQMLSRLSSAVHGPTLSYLDRDASLETLRWKGLLTVRERSWCLRNWLTRCFVEQLLSEVERDATQIPPSVQIGATSGAETIAGNETLDQPEPPLFDNRYRLWRPLSSGAFGVIFEARDSLLGTTVALKRLHPHLSSERIMERFRREVLIARRLSHPHIVRVHDIGQADGSLYYTMEYVSGGNLADRFAALEGQARLALLPLVVQLCEGLDALHVAGIIHRDLKPENALIDDHDQVKLADFGISMALDMGRLTGAGAVGTPLYMSPEQASGEEVTTRSVIYAVGVLLYELFAGFQPFRGDDIGDIIADQIHTTPEDIRVVSDFVPEPVAALIDRALSKEPEGRPESALEMARVLTAAVTSVPA